LSVLNFVLGDRAGSILLASCLVVIALAIIAAIIDIPLGALREAGMGGRTLRMSSSLSDLARGLGIASLLVAVIGAAVQSYLSSTPDNTYGSGLGVLLATDVALLFAVAIWGIVTPLARHWGLCLGAFGFGLAVLFVSLAAVLRLDFQPAGTLADPLQRAAFSAITGILVLAIAACLSSLLGLLTQIVRGAALLAFEHRQHRAVGAAQAGTEILRPFSEPEPANALAALRVQHRRLAGEQPAAQPGEPAD
jgi:hypothetical protein